MEAITRKCANPNCDNTFTVKYNSDPKKFCSKSCSTSFNMAQRFGKMFPFIERKCENPCCSNIFSVKGKNKKQIYCSESCAAIVNNSKRNVYRFCENCQKKLVKPQKFWCSASCRTIGQNRIRQEKLDSTPTELLGEDNRRKVVFSEQNYFCNKCELDTWLARPILLELEHNDGNRNNNIRENLEGLCPNCHSQTET